MSRDRFSLFGAIVLLLCVPGLARHGYGQELAESPVNSELVWSDIAREIALSLIPENHRDERHWGKTEKVEGTVAVRNRQGRTVYVPQVQEVNHGVWRRVSIKPRSPEKHLKISIRNLRGEPDGSTRFELQVQHRARCETSFAIWTYGVKGLNGTIESDVTLRGTLDCSFRIDPDLPAGSFLPEFILRPEFHSLKLNLVDVDTRNVGLIGGWAAEEMGDAARGAVNHLLQDQEKRLLEKVQKSIARKPERLRLKAEDMARLVKGDDKVDSSTESGKKSGEPATDVHTPAKKKK